MVKGKKLYICSPLSASSAEGIESNMLAARMYMTQIAGSYQCRTYAPHAYLPELLDDHNPEERALALAFGLQLLTLCDCLVICGEIISTGMKGEIQAACQLGMKIYRFVERKNEWMLLVEDQKVIL